MLTYNIIVVQDYLLFLGDLECTLWYHGNNPKIFCNISKISILRPLGINVIASSIYLLFMKVQLIKPNTLNKNGTNSIIFILH
jgi:hypothetical protein